MDRKTFSYLDLEILNRPMMLRDAAIILYGAGEKGARISGLLLEAGLDIAAFTDRDAAKWGKRLNGIPIYPPQDMKTVLLSIKGKKYVISCIESTDECYGSLSELLQEDDISIGFISYWGIDLCLYLHRKKLFRNSRNAMDRLDRDAAIDLLKYTREETLDKLDAVLKHTNELWIYQPGKVGSSSVSRMMQDSEVPYLKIHTLLFSEYDFREKLRPVWSGVTGPLNRDDIKIISLVRDPLSRDYSAFWEAFVCGAQRRQYIPGLSADLQEMYNAFTRSIIHRDDSSGGLHVFVWREEFDWFDEEIKEHFGLDVYQYPFDREKGYTVIHKNNVELFLLKLEKLGPALPALDAFIGGDVHLSARRDYSASGKIYSMAYRAFRKEVKLKKAYIDHYFNGNAKVDHFYTKEEQAEFLDKWKDNIET